MSLPVVLQFGCGVPQFSAPFQYLRARYHRLSGRCLSDYQNSGPPLSGPVNGLVVSNRYHVAMAWTRQQISSRLPHFVEKLLHGQPAKRQTFIDEIEIGLAKRGRYDSDAKDQQPIAAFFAGASRLSLKPEGKGFTAKAWVKDEILVTAQGNWVMVTISEGPLTSSAYISALHSRLLCEEIKTPLLAAFYDPIVSVKNEQRNGRAEVDLRCKVQVS